MGTMEISKNAENTKADVMKLIKSNPEKTVSMKKKAAKGTDVKSDGVKYTAVSRDGDTLEISSRQPKQQMTKYSDAALRNMPENMLRTLLANGQITKQQYTNAANKSKK